MAYFGMILIIVDCTYKYILIFKDGLFQVSKHILFTMYENQNLFEMSEQHKNNINKRLPIGFALIKITDRHKYDKTKFDGQINFLPVKRQARAPNITVKTILDIQRSLNKNDTNPVSQSKLKLAKVSYQSSEGRGRHAEKIKTIIQRLRKHQKFPNLYQHMSKIGFVDVFNEIQAQSKRNLLTIDSFKERCLQLLNTMRANTGNFNIIDLIDQIIDELICYVEQAKKTEFEKNLQNIQKSIDKVTRQISEIKEQGNSYLRKKRKSQKNFDDREKIYLGDLIGQLPVPYLVGVWEIIQQKPFRQSRGQLHVDLSETPVKKLRQLQCYVKKKLSTIHKSNRLKKLKNAFKKQEKQLQKKKEEARQMQLNKVQNNKIQFPQEQWLKLPQQKEQNQLIKNKENGKNDIKQQENEYNKSQGFLNFKINEDSQVQDFFMQNEGNKSEKLEVSVIKIDRQESEKQNIELSENQSQQGVLLSSDSSMITDDDDSDF